MSPGRNLPGSGLPGEGHELDGVVEQDVEGEVLLLVPRPDPPDILLERGEPADLLPGGIVPRQRGGVRHGVPQDEILVGEQLLDVRRRSAFPGGVEGIDPALLDHDLAVSLVELLDLHPVALVVLRPEAEGVRLDPEVGVLGHQDHRDLLLPHPDPERHGEDLVVLPVPEELRRQQSRPLAVEGHPEQPSLPEGDAVRETSLLPLPVDEFRCRPGVAPEHVQVLLEAVELLDDGDGNDDPVVLKFEQGVGIVQQDVRVQHEIFDHPASGVDRGLFT